MLWEITSFDIKEKVFNSPIKFNKLPGEGSNVILNANSARQRELSNISMNNENLHKIINQLDKIKTQQFFFLLNLLM